MDPEIAQRICELVDQLEPAQLGNHCCNHCHAPLGAHVEVGGGRCPREIWEELAQLVGLK